MRRLYVDQRVRVLTAWTTTASLRSCFLARLLWDRIALSGMGDQVSWPMCGEASGCNRFKYGLPVCVFFLNLFVSVDGIWIFDVFQGSFVHFQSVQCVCEYALWLLIHCMCFVTCLFFVDVLRRCLLCLKLLLLCLVMFELFVLQFVLLLIVFYDRWRVLVLFEIFWFLMCVAIVFVTYLLLFDFVIHCDVFY